MLKELPDHKLRSEKVKKQEDKEAEEGAWVTEKHVGASEHVQPPPHSQRTLRFPAETGDFLSPTFLK